MVYILLGDIIQGSLQGIYILQWDAIIAIFNDEVGDKPRG